MTLPAIINIAVYGIVAVFALIGFLLGFKRGFKRQTVKFLFICASFGLSYALFSALYPWLYGLVAGKTLAGLMSTYGIGLGESLMKIFECINGDLAVYAAAIPLAMVVFPIAFLIFFLLITLALNFLYIPLCGALGFGSKYNTLLTRIIGGAIGIIQGALIALLVLMPVDGLLDISNFAITNAEKEHPDSTNAVTIANVYHQNLDSVINNPALKFSDASSFLWADEKPRARPFFLCPFLEEK